MVTDELRAEWAAFWATVNEGATLFEGSVVSGIRSKARNEYVGGHPFSRHIKGFAADVSFLPEDETSKSRCGECFAWYRSQGLRGYIRSAGTSLHIQDRAPET